MNKVLLPLVFLLTISLVLGYQDAAAMSVIFEDEPPTDTVFICKFVTNWCADDFVLDSFHSITDAHFWVFESTVTTGFDGIVNYAIYEDDGGEPGAVVADGSGVGIKVQTMTVDDLSLICTNNQNNCLEVWIDLDPPVPLEAGTYWLGIQQNDEWWILVGGPQELSNSKRSTDGINWELIGLDFPLTITGVESIIGGEIIPINTTALLLAGVQSVSMWMIPVVVSGAGIGVFVIMRTRK